MITKRLPWLPISLVGAFLASISILGLAASRPPPSGEDWDRLATIAFSILAFPVGFISFLLGALIGKDITVDRALVCLSLGWLFGIGLSLVPGIILGGVYSHMGTVMFAAFICAPVLCLLVIGCASFTRAKEQR